MRNYFLILLLLLFTLVLSGCGPARDLLTKHDIDMDGVPHGEKLYKAGGAENCTACHGVTLEGNASLIPSCYSCHEALWSNDDHTVNRGGTMHVFSLGTKTNCGPCHGGDSLEGSRSRPSCYECHGDVWTSFERHTSQFGGYYHVPEVLEPETNCIECHGSDLQGEGTAPSCYTCHAYEPWNRDPLTHTVSKGGQMHATQLYDPVGNCSSTDCHGDVTETTGGTTGDATARSCQTCHGSLWDYVQTHTRSEHGYLHHSAYRRPTGICEECHGANALSGGYCYNCHGQKWN